MIPPTPVPSIPAVRSSRLNRIAGRSPHANRLMCGALSSPCPRLAERAVGHLDRVLAARRANGPAEHVELGAGAEPFHFALHRFGERRRPARRVDQQRPAVARRTSSSSPRRRRRLELVVPVMWATCHAVERPAAEIHRLDVGVELVQRPEHVVQPLPAAGLRIPVAVERSRATLMVSVGLMLLSSATRWVSPSAASSRWSEA